MGDPDPTDFINLETQRILFKQSQMDLTDWSGTFRTWPNQVKGWRKWYRRIAERNQIHWDERDIGQCIALSLSNMERNEPLLISASHFWSDTINAFIFGHGPMTITLADVFMLTGLNITGPLKLYDLLNKVSHKLHKIKECSGWTFSRQRPDRRRCADEDPAEEGLLTKAGRRRSR